MVIDYFVLAFFSKAKENIRSRDSSKYLHFLNSWLTCCGRILKEPSGPDLTRENVSRNFLSGFIPEWLDTRARAVNALGTVGCHPISPQRFRADVTFLKLMRTKSITSSALGSAWLLNEEGRWKPKYLQLTKNLQETNKCFVASHPGQFLGIKAVKRRDCPLLSVALNVTVCVSHERTRWPSNLEDVCTCMSQSVCTYQMWAQIH